MEGRAQNDQPDVFRWKWTSSGQYSAASTYRAFFLGLTEQLEVKQLWKIKAPNKCRFFLWLLLHGRCWTSDRLQRHELPNNSNCALCNQEAETLEHLLLHCAYNREVWFRIFRRHGWVALLPVAQQAIIDWWLSMRKRVSKVSRSRFDSIFALVLWRLWNERNVRVFRNRVTMPHHLAERIAELSSWCGAGLVAQIGNG
jgi:hypothetical protein